MLRRTFLKAVGAVGLGALLPQRAEAKAVRRVELATTFIAGFQYHEGMRREVASTLRAGQSVLLIREPENPYDDQAIAVRTVGGRMIGYVPRDLNPVPSIIADQGVRLEAEIVAVDHTAPPWERVAIRFYQVV